MAKERWQQAYDEIREAVDSHGPEDYVLSRRTELRELVQRCALWLAVEEPEYEEVVSGDLVRYSDRKKSLKIEYDSETLEDFEVSKSSYVHPAQFTGSYEIEVRGTEYSEDRRPTLLVGYGEGGFYRAVFPDFLRGKIEDPGYLYYEGTLGEHLLDIDDCKPLKSGKAFKLRMELGKKSVDVYANGKKVMTAERLTKEREDGAFGHAGFTGLRKDDLVSVHLEGPIQGIWIEDLVDRATLRRREAFEEAFDLAEHLPAWLVDGDASEAVEASHRPERPGPADLALGDSWFRAQRYREQGQIEQGISYLLRVNEKRLAPILRDYLLIDFYQLARRYEEALEACRRVNESDPTFLETRLLEAVLLLDLDRDDPAFEVCQRVLNDFPRDPKPAQLFAGILLRGERFDELHAYLDEAADQPERYRALEGMRTLLVRAEQGPSWSEVHEYRGKYYHVYSDFDAKLCREIGRLLDRSHQGYMLHFKRVPGLERKKFRVYVFSGASGFHQYADEVTGGAHEHTAGLYSPTLKQLLIWNLPDREAMFETVRHEAFHQYLDRIAPDAPVWLHEGLAEYYELAGYDSGKWVEGSVDEELVDYLFANSRRLLDLADLLALRQRDFYAEGQMRMNYAESWAFVHFLNHSTERNKQLLETFVERLCEGASGSEAIAATFGASVLAELEDGFADHLRALR